MLPPPGLESLRAGRAECGEVLRVSGDVIGYREGLRA